MCCVEPSRLDLPGDRRCATLQGGPGRLLPGSPLEGPHIIAKPGPKREFFGARRWPLQPSAPPAERARLALTRILDYFLKAEAMFLRQRHSIRIATPDETGSRPEESVAV